MYSIKINVQYLQSVVNPEEERLKEMMVRQDQASVKDVKISRTYTFDVEAASEADAKAIGEALAESTLVNKAMQDYSISVEEA